MRLIPIDTTLITPEGSFSPGGWPPPDVADTGEALALVARGFARELTEAEVARLAAEEGVTADDAPIIPAEIAILPPEAPASTPAAPPAPEVLPEAATPVVKSPAPPAEPTTPEKVDADPIAAIVDALELLDRNNPKHFTAGGKANLDALAEVLGWKPTAAQRDEAAARAAAG